MLQTKPGTFRAHAFPGHGQIFNGFDNMLAAIHYAKARYGTTGMLSVIGHGHGYENGGFSYAHQLAEISENNKPEAIIPLDLSKRPRAYQILSQIISGFAKDEPDNGTFGNTGTSVLQNEVDSLNNKFDTLISLMSELVNGERVTNINVDGRTFARATNSAFRAENALAIERKRRGFSGI